METLILSVIIVSAIGLLLGLILAICSIVFAVPVDEKEVAIRECLPGANCGACGFSGCDGYAGALAKGETNECNRCTPGGNDAAQAIAKIMGVEAGEIVPMSAVVMCRGTCEKCDTKLDYVGVNSCKMAAQLFGGPKSCTFGCLGFGDCANVCDNNCISIVDGIAKIDPENCKACKKCIKACPHNVIDLVPVNVVKASVLCVNHDKGAQTRKDCSAGCIGCMKCVKNCEAGAISIDRFCATVDTSKCTGCGTCESVCPVGAISVNCLKA